jgi:hypothetical protein
MAGIALALCAAVMMLSPASGPIAQTPPSAAGPAPVVPNFDLGARWTSAKVGKLVFDTAVTPHWMQAGERFWYTYQTRDGRRFFIVDPLKKARAPLFDHARMAATLTSITRQPYDAQHLPFSNIRFARNDSIFEFEVQVPRDADIVTTKKKITTGRSRAPATTRRPISSRASAARVRGRRRGRLPATGRCASNTRWRPAG